MSLENGLKRIFLVIVCMNCAKLLHILKLMKIFLTELIILRPALFAVVFAELFEPKEQALRAVRKNSSLFTDYLHRYWSNDRDIVLAAVKSNGMALRYASDELKRDEEVVMAAVQQNPNALQFSPY